MWLDGAMTAGFLLAPRLRPGDRVRLVSPASSPDRASVDNCLAVLDGWGLRGEVAPHVFDKWGYMAGSDADRLDDLNEAFRDPEIRAIVATRGGAGAYRIADRIDTAESSPASINSSGSMDVLSGKRHRPRSANC